MFPPEGWCGKWLPLERVDGWGIAGAPLQAPWSGDDSVVFADLVPIEVIAEVDLSCDVVCDGMAPDVLYI